MRFKELQRIGRREMPDIRGLMTVDRVAMPFVLAADNRYGWSAQI
jgi:hypothetical protein